MSRERGLSSALSGLELQGRQNVVCLGQLGMSHEDSVPSITGTEQEFGGWDEKKCFFNIFLQYCNKPPHRQQGRIKILC